jgi:hypothetical protein
MISMNGGARQATPTAPPEGVAALLGCLNTQPWGLTELASIGVKRGSRAYAVVDSSEIKGVEPHSSPPPRNLILLAPDREHGVLFSFRDDSSRSILVRNLYRLKKSNGHWEASEGNGGVATCAAVGAYADGIAPSRYQRIFYPRNADPCEVQ